VGWALEAAHAIANDAAAVCKVRGAGVVGRPWPGPPFLYVSGHIGGECGANSAWLAASPLVEAASGADQRALQSTDWLTQIEGGYGLPHEYMLWMGDSSVPAI